MTTPIRVLIADDSQGASDALLMLLAEYPSIDVVGVARDGVEAIELATALRPDVLTMDVGMPKLDGLAATRAIMADAPTRIIVVSAVDHAARNDVCFRAIAAGALELLPKPKIESFEELRRWGGTLVETIHLMAEIPVVRRRWAPEAPARSIDGKSRRGAPPSARLVHVFGLVASTGGPAALATVLAALPADLPIPLLVAQHLAHGFTAGLVHWLSQVSALRVVVARNGEFSRAGHVYLPPDGDHLEVEAGGVLRLSRGLDAGSMESSHHETNTPSGDRLLGSMARAYGRRAGGVVLTGMGDDGTEGLLAIRAAGGVTLTQDQATSVVFGMPRAALERGAAAEVLPLQAMAHRIYRASATAPFRANHEKQDPR
jgi:two-component system chemotaxis response regulator CheB